ncbi:hypothetical protein AEGHOMDF_0084 [Methylobacterium soli]|nr:hypothetical protein AEGHOMDF_0084 [Methylobacterium soli]
MARGTRRDRLGEGQRGLGPNQRADAMVAPRLLGEAAAEIAQFAAEARAAAVLRGEQHHAPASLHGPQGMRHGEAPLDRAGGREHDQRLEALVAGILETDRSGNQRRNLGGPIRDLGEFGRRQAVDGSVHHQFGHEGIGWIDRVLDVVGRSLRDSRQSAEQVEPPRLSHGEIRGPSRDTGPDHRPSSRAPSRAGRGGPGSRPPRRSRCGPPARSP